MTEKTVWEIYSLGIQQRQPRMTGDIVCLRPGLHSSLAAWPERARLICAAPDLLAACDLALEWSRPVTEGTRPLGWALEVQPALEAAVAKAKGVNAIEPEPFEDEVAPLTAGLDEPAPALKTWWVSMAEEGSRTFVAERLVEFAGVLRFFVGDTCVGAVADGRWNGYWEDLNA